MKQISNQIEWFERVKCTRKFEFFFEEFRINGGTVSNSHQIDSSVKKVFEILWFCDFVLMWGCDDDDVRWCVYESEWVCVWVWSE
jgi:hypothetical protein